LSVCFVGGIVVEMNVWLLTWYDSIVVILKV